MGDRGNIKMEIGEKKPIYFYTHWAGSDIGAIARRALERGRSRWDDEQYLTRIVFCQFMLDAGIHKEGADRAWAIVDAVGDTTSYGISTEVGDNEHPILEINTEAQEVVIGGARMKFQEFVELSDTDAIKWHQQAHG